MARARDVVTVVLVAVVLLSSAQLSLNPRASTALDPKTTPVAPYSTPEFDSVGSASPATSGCTQCVVSNISTFDGVDSMAIDPSLGVVFAVGSGGLDEISTSTDTVVGSVEAGVHPVAVAYVPSNGNVYVVNHGANAGSSFGNVSVFSASTLDLITTIPAGINPAGVAYDNATNQLYVPDQGSNNVSVIGASNETDYGSIPVGTQPDGAAFDWQTGQIFVTNLAPSGGTPGVTEIWGMNNTVAGFTRVSNGPEFPTYDSQNGDVYVAGQESGIIAVVSDSNDSLYTNVSIAAGSIPTGLAVEPGSGGVYVSERGTSSQLALFSGSTNSVLSSWSVSGLEPGVLLLDSANGDLYLACPDQSEVALFSPLASVPFIQAFNVSPNPAHLNGTTVFAANVSGGETPYSYSYVGLPQGCNSVDSSTLTCKPTQAGSFVVELQVADAIGYFTSDVRLSVTPGPSLAVETSLATVEAEQEITFTTEVSGGQAPFNFTYTPSTTAAGCTPSYTFELNCTPAISLTLSSFNVSVRVIDANSLSASVRSAPVFVTPALLVNLSLSDYSPLLGQTISLTANASGGVSPWSYYYSGLPPGCVSQDFFAIGCLPTESGWYNVSVHVHDGNDNNVSSTVLLHVIFDFNVVVPASTPLGQQLTILVNTNATFEGNSSEPLVRPSEGFGTLTYNYSGLPPGCVSRDSSTLTCTPSQEGRFYVTVSVHDSAGDHQAHTVVVNVVAASSASPWFDFAFFGPYGFIVWGGVGAVVLLGAVLLLRRKGRNARGADQQGAK